MSVDRATALAEGRRELWRRGQAALYLLDTHGPTGGQQAWVRMLDATPPGSWAALEVSRQRGKTFTILTWAFQRLGLDSLAAVFLAQTGANAEAIVRQFLKDVGDDLPPEWGARLVDGVVRFTNGSELAVFGTDNAQYRRSRGRKAHIVLLSEAAFYADLADVEQVYQPQLQTTGGVGVYESSPALNPGHEFSRRCDAAAAVGRYVRDTFWSLLPIAGEDGSLASRFRGVRNAAEIRAKTGSVSHVAALAGYAGADPDHRIAFSIMVNNYTAPSSEIRSLIDKIASAILEEGKR